MKRRTKRRKQKKKHQKSAYSAQEWSDATGAHVVSIKSFLQEKEHCKWYTVGVLGYAGSWKHAPFTGELLVRWQHAMHTALHQVFASYSKQYPDRWMVISGATAVGVLNIAYTLCHTLSIPTMGIAPDRALQHPLARLDRMLPYGKSFGDESKIFVQLCDAFVVLGGGAQSKKELHMATRQGKPITVIQGFGGIADALTPEELPTATWIQWPVQKSMSE